ncbi:hypothetical protein Tco_1235894, partial [Tanacetum coccineum]
LAYTSRAGDADYLQKAMTDYHVEYTVPFTLLRCWEVLKECDKCSTQQTPHRNPYWYGYSSVGRFDVFFPNQLLVFQQHQDESLYDSWTRFKDVPRCMAWLDYDEHEDSLSTMDNEVGVTSPESTTPTLPSFKEYTLPVTYPKEVEMTLGTLIEEVSPLGEELSLFDRPNEVERGRILEAHRLEPILQQQISQRMAPSHHDGRKGHLLEDKQIPSVGVPRCMAWLDYDEHVDSLSMMDNEVGVISPESTTQTLPLFEEYIPLMTYPEEVKKTLGTPIEVELLNETKLEEVGSNCNHNTPPSSREVSSFDGPEPQPLLNIPSLDVSLGDVIGIEPPIKPHSLDSSRMKVVDYLITQTPPLPHVANSHPKGLESKEVSPLGEELSFFDRPNEVDKGRILEAHLLEPILQQQISQRMVPSHHDGRKAHLLEDKQILSVGVFDEVYLAFGGNTRDSGSFEEETDKITNQHQDSSRFKVSAAGDDVTIYTQRRHTSSSDGVTTFLDDRYTISLIRSPPREVVFGKPFARNTGLVYDQEEGTVTFEKDDEKITFKMPHKMEASNRIDFKNINTDSISPVVLGSNDNHGKTITQLV